MSKPTISKVGYTSTIEYPREFGYSLALFCRLVDVWSNSRLFGKSQTGGNTSQKVKVLLNRKSKYCQSKIEQDLEVRSIKEVAQKNLLKQQFETFTIGSREELDSAYERFQHILSMLELHDATVSIEDANLKFLRSLPSVWHVVATMIRGQPGLDELDFDDLYNNLKVYEHELKGVSNSNSQNIAFLSTEVKGSTLKQSTAEPAHIPKGYTQAASSKVPTAPNYASHSDEIICSFFSQQASMPTTHDDEDLLQIFMNNWPLFSESL
ncbi:hypothetical protein Tco_0599451 [Tanacetum coccineum]